MHAIRCIRATRRIEVDAIEAHDVFLVIMYGICVGHAYRLDATYPFDPRNGVKVGIIETERPRHVQVARIRRVIELVCRDVHVNRGHEQTCEKSAAKRRNDGNRQEASHGMRDGPMNFLVECACHSRLHALPYHSIEAAELGASLNSTEATLPSWM